MLNKNTKIWKSIIIVGICICIVMGSYAYYLYVSTWKTITPPYRQFVGIYFNQTVTDEGWYLEVSVIDSYDDCKDRTLVCELRGGPVLESVELSKIKNNPSSGYNITWFDNDNNNYLSVEDVIFVSKTGGTVGKATPGNRIYIVDIINRNIGMGTGHELQ